MAKNWIVLICSIETKTDVAKEDAPIISKDGKNVPNHFEEPLKSSTEVSGEGVEGRITGIDSPKAMKFFGAVPPNKEQITTQSATKNTEDYTSSKFHSGFKIESIHQS